MRKSLFVLLMGMLVLGFAACSDNKEDDKSLAEKLAGVYTGTIDVYSVTAEGEQGEQIGGQLTGQKMYMTATGENALRLELKNFNFAGIVIASIKVDTKVSTDGKNTISGRAENIQVIAGITATADVTGSIAGDKADLKINVEAPLSPDTDPIKMLVKFLGTK